MANTDILNVLYAKNKSPLEFKWDSMIAPPLYSLLTKEDIYRLYKIATSIKYSAKINKKYKMIDDIVTRRGFKKFASGTNRVIYNYLENKNIVLKIAFDRVGLSDNGNEFKNQFYLKPFVARMFEVSECGTVGIAERVQPITNRYEFKSVAGDVFNLLVHIIGKYILSDVGTNFFMNYGLRTGFGVVLLDYPYLYQLDGNKLHCNKMMENHHACGGLIDYDDGFNNLICTKCGRIYKATELKKAEEEHSLYIEKKYEDFNVKVIKGDEIISEFNNDIKESNIIK